MMDFTKVTEWKQSRWQTLRMKLCCLYLGHRYQIGDDHCYDCGRKEWSERNIRYLYFIAGIWCTWLVVWILRWLTS